MKRRREGFCPFMQSLEAPMVPCSPGALLQSLSPQLQGEETKGQVTQCPGSLLVPPSTLHCPKFICFHSGEAEELKNAFLHPGMLPRAGCSPKSKRERCYMLKGAQSLPAGSSSLSHGLMTSPSCDDLGPFARMRSPPMVDMVPQQLSGVTDYSLQ